MCSTSENQRRLVVEITPVALKDASTDGSSIRPCSSICGSRPPLDS